MVPTGSGPTDIDGGDDTGIVDFLSVLDGWGECGP